ncbi:MAG TPA: AbrB/MazE/SpoVT family DNA-binding domain-containing protein [Candidatus Onthoplasma faecipullorum]|nr:AbrB/MazE/SpoVT family DNA-binding domain-containing protein [Candidatus Onthoplasma faecipullorum]
MESKGIVRRVDELGRIVLPREMRKMLNVRVGSKLEIGVVDGNKFLLTKYSDMVSLKEYSDAVATAISVSIEHDVLISDMEKVLSSNKKKYINKDLTDEVQELIYKKEIVIKKQDDGSEMLEFFVGGGKDYSCELIVPIIKDGDAIGSIIILAMENKCFDDSAIKICKAFSKYLSDQIS